ncbi:MAG: hypothetical protein SGPRY_010294 [Prymnesium sp.]
MLKKAIYLKKKGVSDVKTLEQAFKQFDVDKSGFISFKEFCAAMERFGLTVAEETPGRGGTPLQGLFDRYDSDACGYLSYKEFATGLLGRELDSGKGVNPTLPSLTQEISQPASSLGNTRPSTASLATESHVRVRSLANPARRTEANAFKTSSKIFG